MTPPELVTFTPRAPRGLELPQPPVPLTALVGRDRDVELACETLRRADVRLLTLTGAGGVGKTRLAIAVANALSDDFAGGAGFVSLASVREPELVESTLAEALGVRDHAGRSLAQSLQQALDGSDVLLVLDNFEQVAAAAPAIANLVASAQRLKVLVTSRERLRISGEREFVVAPLEVPRGAVRTDPEALAALAENPAISLFVERVGAVRPDFELGADDAATVAEICRRLDGLPLALELAAARAKLLSLSALLTRLERSLPLLTGGPRDQPARQQTLRDTIIWSHDLLTTEEQILFRRLSVFVGGFTLDAAEAVASEGRRVGGSERASFPSGPPTLRPSDLDVLDGVASLVDKSLLRQLESDEGGDFSPRYSFLETVREYGLEVLAASGEEEAIRSKHAAWCLDLLEQTWSVPIAGPMQVKSLGRIDGDLGNLRSALTWLEQTGDAAAMQKLAGLLGPYWAVRSYRTEGRRWLERAIALPRADEAPAVDRARALHGAAALARTQDDAARATFLAEAGLTLYQEMHDPLGMAASHNLLGVLARGRGEFEQAANHGQEALHLFEQLGDESWVALSRCNLGVLAFWQGDSATARPLLEAALAGFRALDDTWGVAFTLHGLAAVVGEGGNFAAAATMLRESVRHCREIGAKESLVDAIAGIGDLASDTGRFLPAARLFGTAEANGQALGYSFEVPERTRYAAAAAAARSGLGEDAYHDAWTAGRALSLDQAAEEADALAAEMDSVSAGGGTGAGTPLGVLTLRELEVLRLLVEGMSDREIGDALFISHRTAMRHVANIFTKLDVNSRTAAAALAHKYDIG